MGMFTGKKGVILGVANDHSLAWAIAEYLHKEGAELAFNHLPDKGERNRNERRIRQLAEPLPARLIAPCDVSSDSDIEGFFSRVHETMGTIDFLVHSVAFAQIDDLRCRTLDCSRDGFKLAMDISCYSLLATARAAEKLMPNGGAMLTLSYFGGEKVIAGYNMMGLCKAALEMAVRYSAFELGPKKIRMNAVSAGPVRTLAASAVGDFREMLNLYSAVSPMGRNITPDEVATSAAFLLSSMAGGITGEVLHVDCGYSIMGGPGHALERLAAGKEEA